MSNTYDIQIRINEKTNQIKVEIISKYSHRQFDILVNKDGLQINGNDTLGIIPVTGKKINIDMFS